MTTPLARVIATAALLVVQGACMGFGYGKPKPTDPGSHAGSGTRARANNGLASPGFGPKPVHGKQAPSRLIAHDGTSCLVPREKFEKTTIGTSVWCVWTDTNR